MVELAALVGRAVAEDGLVAVLARMFGQLGEHARGGRAAGVVQRVQRRGGQRGRGGRKDGQFARRWGGQQPVALQPRGRAAAARHGAGGQTRRKALQAVRIQRGGGQGPAALQQRAGQRPVGGRLLHERRMARAEGQDAGAVGGKAGCVQRIVQTQHPLGRAGVFAVQRMGRGGVQEQRPRARQAHAVQAAGVA